MNAKHVALGVGLMLVVAVGVVAFVEHRREVAAQAVVEEAQAEWARVYAEGMAKADEIRVRARLGIKEPVLTPDQDMQKRQLEELQEINRKLSK